MDDRIRRSVLECGVHVVEGRRIVTRVKIGSSLIECRCAGIGRGRGRWASGRSRVGIDWLLNDRLRVVVNGRCGWGGVIWIRIASQSKSPGHAVEAPGRHAERHPAGMFVPTMIPP